jgi:hypothetical protein
MPRVTRPVAGTLTNYTPLIAEGYAGKTGSDSAAGGCLAFFTRVTVGGHELTAVGVVMGQGQGSDTSLILAAAGEAAKRLVESVAPTAPVSVIPTPAAGLSRPRRLPCPPARTLTRPATGCRLEHGRRLSVEDLSRPRAAVVSPSGFRGIVTPPTAAGPYCRPRARLCDDRGDGISLDPVTP